VQTQEPMQGVSARITGRVYEVAAPTGNGPVVVTVRVSHGKDKNTGDYRPSSWYRIKCFTAKQTELAKLNPQKDDLVTFEVYGGTDEWTDKEGKKRSDKVWYYTAGTKHASGQSYRDDRDAKPPSAKDYAAKRAEFARPADPDEVPW